MHDIARVLKSVVAVLLAFGTLALPPFVPLVSAASSAGCEGGGFVITGLNDERPINTDGDFTIPANNVGTRFTVAGKYVTFIVVAASLGVENWTLTGAATPLDITGNRRTVAFASKP